MEINSINTRQDIKNTKEKNTITSEQLLEIMFTSHETEYSTLTKNETEQIIKSINELDLNKDRYSKGTEGSIFKIQIKDENNQTKEYIAAKKRYDNNPDNERHIHQGIEKAMEKSTITSEIKVPKLKAVITLASKERFIIMEFIKGKTIYQLELEEIFKKQNIPMGELTSDIEAEATFFKLLKLNQTNTNDCEKAQRIYTQERKNIKLFSPEQGQKYKEEIKKFLQIIHQEGIYHRDCSNPRNVMITENGEMYIIDFGKSLWTKNKYITEKNIYEKQEGENMIGIHPRDEEVVAQISGLTKSSQDIEREKEEEEWKTKINNIKSDNSVIEYLEHIPKGRIKNKEKEKEILAKIKKQAEAKKQIRFQEMEEANKEDLIILLLAQSKENIPLVLNQLISKKNTQKTNIEKEKEQQKNIPRYTLSGGEEAIKRHKDYHEKNIRKIELQIKKIENIEDKILYLQRETNQ